VKCARSAHGRRGRERGVGGKGEGHCVWVEVEGESGGL
jgi:hypothetical protein